MLDDHRKNAILHLFTKKNLSSFAGPVFLWTLAFGLRWGFFLQNGGRLLPDSNRYLLVGESLFQSWDGGIYDTPGMPLLVALIGLFSDDSGKLFLIQAVLDSFSTVAVWAIAKRLGLGRWALAVGFYHALNPANLVFANAYLSETLFCFLTVTALWSFARLGTSPTRISCLLCGSLVGATCLTRSNGLLFLAVLSAVLVLVCRRRWGSHQKDLVLAAALLPICLWLPFNHHQHRFWGISQGAGWQFLQSVAYAEIFDPALLPPTQQGLYTDWTSLGTLRALDFQGTVKAERHRLDGRYFALALAAVKADPIGYIQALPKMWRLPRAEVLDMSLAPTRADVWRNLNEQAHFNYYLRPLNQRSPYNRLYALLSLGCFQYKTLILIGFLLPGAYIFWRTREPLLGVLVGVPLANAMILGPMLNAVDRYYFPFESMMVLNLMWVCLHFGRWLHALKKPDAGRSSAGSF